MIRVARSIIALGAVAALSLGGCGGGGKGLVIISPAEGEALTLADDANPSTEGVEVAVQLNSTGFKSGDEIGLYVDAEPLGDPDATPVATGSPDGDGKLMLVTGSPLSPGEHTLVACEEPCDSNATISNEVTITVTEDCAEITYLSPAPPSGGASVTLGEMDDVDGEACGAQFTTHVQVSTDAGSGQEATLFVNGNPHDTVTIDGTVARWEDVVLDNRGDTANSLEVEVTNTEGVMCRQAFPAAVFVDCDGPSCQITRPDTESRYLNQSDDVSDAEGFQTHFDVTTDDGADGSSVGLIVDGGNIGTMSPRSEDGGGVATFESVELSEGIHRVRARCSDSVGNVTESGTAEWIVDTTPCNVSIAQVAGGADPITDLDDVDSETDGIQVEMTGSSGGDECSGIRLASCASIDSAPFDVEAMESWSGQVTLGSTPMQELCAEIQDVAGNVARDMTSVNVRTEAPQVEIVTPATGTAYNVSGSGGRTADRDTDTDQCEAEFVVNCTDVGQQVAVVREATDVVLGTADCVDADVAAPFEGQATFDMLPLPTRNDGSSYSVVARQQADGLVGLSEPISVQADCKAPGLSIARPECPSILRPSQDDESTDSGFQYRVAVQNLNTPKPPVTLEIRTAGGGGTVYTETSSTPEDGSATQFPDADFGSGGDLELEGCATDNAGNTGCSNVCNVTVEELPTLSITVPGDGSVLTGADDCDGGTSGLQVRVRATTDASAGSSATVQIGSGPEQSATVMSGSPNFVEKCVDAPQGRDVPVTVTVAGGDVSATVTVDIDTAPPPDAINDLSAAVADRRGGEVTFSWSSVIDDGGFLLDHYELRCADAPIADETDWDNATPRTMTTSPASDGTSQSETIGGFKPGTTQYCALRGADVAGNLTPFDSSLDVEVMISLLQSAVTASGSMEMGREVVAVGDVSGDDIDDVLIAGGSGGDAHLYFGVDGGFDTSPDVTIQGPGGTFYGEGVAALGDFNGDGMNDFAISAPTNNSVDGTVYVFFGQASAGDWDPTIDLSLGCEADACFHGTEGGAFGVALAGANFNDDAFQDLIVGASTAGNGKVFVVLGDDAAYGGGSEFGLPALAPLSEPDGFELPAPSGTDTMGRSLTSPGDVDADGRDDVAIGAPGSKPDMIPGALLLLNGRAYGGDGGLSDIDPSGVTTIDTGTRGRFAHLVRSVGDIDGNGRADLAAYRGFNKGRAFVYPRTSSGFDSADKIAVSNDLADTDGDAFGTSIGLGFHPALGTIGDLDGDGQSDLIVGSSERSTSIGTVDLFYGQDPLPDPMRRSESDVVLDPSTDDSSGRRSAAYVGDVNNDGWPDMAVGDQNHMSDSGRVVFVY